ncbi:MAG: tetratricopeptide repeat protein [Kofleriaceae bacterium]
MLRACALAMVLVGLAGTSPALAKPRAPVTRAAPNADFWRDVIEPNSEEVAQLVLKARHAIKVVDDALQSDAEWAVDQRMRYYQDAFHLMRHARTLSPENTAVLAMLGRAADEIGKTRVAIDALEAAARLLGPDKVTPEVVGRLGAIYLRMGDRDAAIRYLRLAQTGTLTGDETALALVHLANALAARGEVPAAIDVLVNALPPATNGYYTNELALVTFTLGVIYDRDEQRSAAFEVLDRMKTALSTNFGTQMQNALSKMRFAPAEDQHYYLGLLYEIQGQYVEARASFATYAASGDSPWRGRALEHVHAIDEQRRDATPAKKAKTPPVVRTPRRPPP